MAAFPSHYYYAPITGNSISYAFKARVARVIAMSLDIRRHPPRTFPACFGLRRKNCLGHICCVRPQSQYLKSNAQTTWYARALGKCLRKCSHAEFRPACPFL
jgi:hypothetical protein